MPRAFFVVLAVQFLATLADNAFLIVAIGRVVETGAAAWVIPLLKLSFTLAYVVLAPFVGPLADSFAKGRVMLVANALKVVAVTLLLLGAEPTLAIGLVGLGAAAYAPAKYGLMTELVRPRHLVRANGYFESATVCAVIFGTALGGILVSPWAALPHGALSAPWSPLASSALLGGMLCLLALNMVATVLCLGIADSGVRQVREKLHPLALVRRFHRENCMLWRDPAGRISMSVTTFLWAIGATLQLMVLRWANESLGLPLAQAAYLQGVTAIGIVAGAIMASRWVRLWQVTRLVPLGILLGCLIPYMLAIDSVPGAAVLMVVVGAVAGLFVVPMNALLQHRGCKLLTTGRSIAVQGFNENAGMLVMLGLYAAATAAQVSLNVLVAGFSALVTLGMAGFYVSQQRFGFRRSAPSGARATAGGGVVKLSNQRHEAETLPR